MVHNGLPLATEVRVYLGKHAWLPWAAVLSGVTAVHVLSLLRTPAPFVDEAWLASRAWALVQSGRAFGALDSGVLDRFNGYWTFFPWLGTWLESLFIRALGPTLFAARVTSLTFGFILLAAVYAIGRRLYGSRVGLLAACLVALSSPFSESAHLGRPDIIAAAFGFIAVALHFATRGSNSWTMNTIAGLVIGLAFDVHPNAMIYGCAIVALFVLEYGWSAPRSRSFWGFIVGAVVGLALYPVLHILPYPRTYFAMTETVFGSSKVPPFAVLDPGVWLRSLVDTISMLVRSGDLRAPAVGLALILLWRSRSASDRALMGLLAAMFLGFVALTPWKPTFYAIQITPVIDLLLAVFLYKGWQRIWNASVRSNLHNAWTSDLPVVAISGVLLAGTVLNLASLRDDSTAEFQATLDSIRQVVPRDSSIIGPQTYWLGLSDHRYLSWEQLAYYRRYAPGSTLVDAFCSLDPDFFIIDRDLERFITDDEAGLPPWARVISLPRVEVQRFLDEQAHLVATTQTKAFGNVRVYKIDRNCGAEQISH